MSRISILPDHVASQIAAGEVVERPASVVKELVENAIDAEATRITVEIQSGGRTLIRVTDDGIGMSYEDALLAIERHGTSKLREAKDLSHVLTMGFRGEALPSIASVCRFTLTTRERDNESPDGTEVIINGGKLVSAKAAGASTGTCIEIRNLFFNVPARRKFLRTDETERSHIHHYLTLAALAHPGIAMTFRNDGRIVWQLPAAATNDPSPALKERLRALYGTELDFVPVDLNGDLPGAKKPVRIWGFTGSPALHRATRQDQHLFINRRPIENRGLSHAIMEGYDTSLAKGRFPVCCLFLEIEPALVDINIHPAKREVKFQHEFAVRRLLTEAIADALVNTVESAAPTDEEQATKEINSTTEEGKTTEPARASQASNSAPPAPAPPPAAPAAPKATPAPPSLPGLDPASSPSEASPSPAAKVTAPAPQATEPASTAPRPPAPSPAAPPSPTTVTASGQAIFAVPLRLLGIVSGSFAAFESDRGLVLMDCRAAHERVLYEKALKSLDDGSVQSQRLLLPETVELAPRDAAFVRLQLEQLAKMGVGLSEFGEQTFLLDALPPFVKDIDARQFVIQLIDELKGTGEAGRPTRLTEKQIARAVCHRAVNSGSNLSRAEIESLVQDLRRCRMPYTCPAGRPTLIEMSTRELERRFGR